MSFTNYEWYGWVVFVLAVAYGTLIAVQTIQVIADRPGSNVRLVDLVVAAALVAGAIGMALP